MPARSKGRRIQKQLRKETRQSHAHGHYASGPTKQAARARLHHKQGILGLGILPGWFFPDNAVTSARRDLAQRRDNAIQMNGPTSGFAHAFQDALNITHGATTPNEAIIRLNSARRSHDHGSLQYQAYTIAIQTFQHYER